MPSGLLQPAQFSTQVPMRTGPACVCVCVCVSVCGWGCVFVCVFVYENGAKDPIGSLGPC